ncbi:O-antigen ligase family protein [Thalassolituus sp. LLYu03]|uniref:O-antigen ligase family protein n=1 Tax=Thalassolituus sp. LLYu03 TaxID=3421656 RepID=UPI003D278CFE
MNTATSLSDNSFKKIIGNFKKNIYPFVTTLAICIFIALQPIKKSFATDITILFWLLGTLLLATGKLPYSILRPYKGIIITGLIFFLISATSLLSSSYTFRIQELEPELRMLLLPLTIVGIYYSGINFKHLLIALMVGSLSYAWVAYNQSGGFEMLRRAHGDENAVGFGNGSFLLATISVYLSLSHWKSSKFYFIIGIVSATLFLYSAIAANTRGSLLAIPAISIFVIFNLRKVGVTIGTLAAVTLISAAIYQSPLKAGFSRANENFIRYAEGSENNKNSTGYRLMLWESAICMAKKEPFFGVGTHKFRAATQDRSLDCDYNSIEPKRYFTQAHSLYFNTLATMGFSGLLCLILFGYFVCKESLSLHPYHPHRYAAVIALLTIAGYSLTVDAFFIRFIADKHLTLLGIVLGIMLHEQKKITSELQHQPSS